MRTLGALILFPVLALSACDSNPDEAAPQCPLPTVLPDAATFTRTTGRGHDLADLVLTGKLLSVSGACSGIEGGHRVRARAHVVAVITRGPASRGNTVEIPYMVGVSRGDAILEPPHRYMLHVTFPPNTDSVQVQGEEIDLLFHLKKGETAHDYRVLAGFALSAAELDANRRQLAP